MLNLNHYLYQFLLAVQPLVINFLEQLNALVLELFVYPLQILLFLIILMPVMMTDLGHQDLLSIQLK
jgi:hypothetical protein